MRMECPRCGIWRTPKCPFCKIPLMDSAKRKAGRVKNKNKGFGTPALKEKAHKALREWRLKHGQKVN